jgi:hypothetical protein
VRILMAGTEEGTEEISDLLGDPDIEIVGWVENADETTEMIDALQPDVLVAEASAIDAVRKLASPPLIVLLPPRDRRQGTMLGDGPGSQSGLLRTCVALAAATPRLNQIKATRTVNGSGRGYSD